MAREGSGEEEVNPTLPLARSAWARGCGAAPLLSTYPLTLPYSFNFPHSVTCIHNIAPLLSFDPIPVTHTTFSSNSVTRTHAAPSRSFYPLKPTHFSYPFTRTQAQPNTALSFSSHSVTLMHNTAVPLSFYPLTLTHSSYSFPRTHAHPNTAPSFSSNSVTGEEEGGRRKTERRIKRGRKRGRGRQTSRWREKERVRGLSIKTVLSNVNIQWNFLCKFFFEKTNKLVFRNSKMILT